MKLTKAEAERFMKEKIEGSLDLSSVTEIPEGFNPTVGGWIFLNSVKEIPEGFNPTVGGSLDLSSVTEIPEGFNPTVGGNLYLRSDLLRKCKVNKLKHGDYVPERYIFADGILTHIKAKREIKGYFFYKGKIPNRNVVFDGTNYAHCKTLKDGIIDLKFKAAKDRGTEQYSNLTLDSELSPEELIEMYRVITGACRQGTENFVSSLGQLKEKYTIREAIEITRGQYNSAVFAEFFEK